MTINLLVATDGNPPGVYNFAPAEEARLIAAGVARAYSSASAGLSPAQVAAFNDGQLLAGDGGLYALSEVTPYVKVTATGTAVTGPCELAGFDVIDAGSAGTLAIYDATSADAGRVVLATVSLTEVSSLEWRHRRALTAGCHVVIGGSGVDVNVLVG